MVEMEEDGEECSMGPNQAMLIPPSSVTLNLEGWRGRRRWPHCTDMYLCTSVYLSTVEPLNNGHIGTDHIACYREVIPFWRVSFSMYMYLYVLSKQGSMK